MSENFLNGLNKEEKNQQNQQSQIKQKPKDSMDINKFNTYSQKGFDDLKKSSLGFNETLDIAKFNSKISAYEKETNERKNLVDQLFDESFSNDNNNKQQENHLNNNIHNENNDNTNEIKLNSNREEHAKKEVHLFTESAHELSARESDLFAFDKRLSNINSEIIKNSDSAFNFNNNPAGFVNNTHDILTDNNEISNNRYKNKSLEKVNAVVPVYANIKDNTTHDHEHDDKYVYKDKVVDKNYLISRLFSDTINTEADVISNLNKTNPLAEQHNEINNNLNNKIEPFSKILLNENITKTINENNFKTQGPMKIKNPFDDTEDQIHSNTYNESVNDDDFNKPQSSRLLSSNIINNTKNNNSLNPNTISISNVDERISFTNPNFIVGNLDNNNNSIINHSNQKESGTDIISRFNEKPFKSINFGDHELERGPSSGEIKANLNLNNFDSFDNNNINNDKNNSNAHTDNKEVFDLHANINYDKSLEQKIIKEADREKEKLKESLISKSQNPFKRNVNLSASPAVKEEAEADAAAVAVDGDSKFMTSSKSPFMASDRIKNFDKSKKTLMDESDFNLLGANDSGLSSLFIFIL